MKYPLLPLALEYCTGYGLEIDQAAHNPYGVNAENVDLPDRETAIWRDEQWKMCGEVATVDIYAEGDELPVRNLAVDFLLASHIVEHMPNPIKALRE